MKFVVDTAALAMAEQWANERMDSIAERGSRFEFTFKDPFETFVKNYAAMLGLAFEKKLPYQKPDFHKQIGSLACDIVPGLMFRTSNYKQPNYLILDSEDPIGYDYVLASVAQFPRVEIFGKLSGHEIKRELNRFGPGRPHPKFKRTTYCTLYVVSRDELEQL